MILVQGTMKIRADRRDECIAACNEMRAATIDEDGCLGYRFGFTTDDPDTLMVAEQWRDDDALAAHAATPHMAAFGKAIGEVIGGPADVLRYDASEGKPLFG